MTWATDGTKYTWEQKGRVEGTYGKIVTMVTKTAGAEDVWDAPTVSVPFNPNPSKYEKLAASVEKKLQKILDEFGEEYLQNYLRDLMIYDEDENIEDEIAYLKDVRYDEKGDNRRSVKKRFIRQKMDERRTEEGE